jgi:hypothetical protein
LEILDDSAMPSRDAYEASYLHVLPKYQRKDPLRPVILGETGYEDEPNAIELLLAAKRGDLWNPYRIRRNAWWPVLSGASGYCAGTRLCRFEKNWREVLNAKSSQQAPLLRRMLEPRPWWRLAPDDHHELVTEGYGTWRKTDYVTAALADNGSLAVVYMPKESAIKVGWTRQGAGRIQTPSKLGICPEHLFAYLACFAGDTRVAVIRICARRLPDREDQVGQ